MEIYIEYLKHSLDYCKYLLSELDFFLETTKFTYNSASRLMLKH